MDLRPVGAEHRDELATFRCATKGEDFSLDVEEEIRENAADAISSGTVEALGSWDGHRLGALIVYAPRDWAWLVLVLATDHDYRRRKQAVTLKRAVLDRAASAGAAVVVSQVDRRNDAMLALNRKLGAAIEPHPDPDLAEQYLVCSIPLTGRR